MIPRPDGVENLLVDSRPEFVLEVPVTPIGDLRPAVDSHAAGPVLPAGDVRRGATHREDLHAVELDVELRKMRGPLQKVGLVTMRIAVIESNAQGSCGIGNRIKFPLARLELPSRLQFP